MKKIMLILLTVVLIFCSACKNKESLPASDIMARILTDGAGTGDSYTYIDGADPASENYISDEELGSLYYKEKSAPAELESVSSYCIRISKSKSVKEIHILKAKYQSDTDTIIRMLNRRKKLLTESEINPGSADFYTRKAKECEVFSRGKFVFLIAGENISAVIKIIDKNI